MRKVFSRTLLLSVTLMLAAGTLRAVPGNRGKPDVPFDVNEVVSRASHATRQGNGPGLPLGSGEFVIDAGSVYGTAPVQYNPAVAFDGTNYLVVWVDGGICGERVSPTGALLDTTWFTITAQGDEDNPAVAFDGADYLVVWEDVRSEEFVDVYGARVSPSGTVLDPLGIPISTDTNNQFSPSLASDGTNCLVAWEDNRVGDDVYGARVTQSGAVLDPSGIAISTAAGDQRTPVVTFGGGNYFVVWEDAHVEDDIYGARVSPAGAVLDPSGIVVSTAAGGRDVPVAAFDGTNYFVAWEDSRSGGYDIYCARVSQGGALLDPSGIAVATAANSQYNPMVVFLGTSCFVAWEDSSNDSSWDIRGARVSPAGAVLDPSGIAVSTAANGQATPAAAFDGTNCFVVWEDDRIVAYHGDIYGARVSRAGTLLDPSGIVIAAGPINQYSPAVAFDGTNYLVVWTDDRLWSQDIYGCRVSPTGALLDPSAILVATAAGWRQYPAVAFDGTNYLVVWEDFRDYVHYDIYGARVTQAGTVLDTAGGIAISTAIYDQRAPALAFDGTNYLVVWEDSRSHFSYDLYGARVTRAGAVLDGGPTVGIAISTAASDQTNPAVAFDGANYLVVWQDRRSGREDIYGARVAQAGTVLDGAGIAISTAANNQYIPAVTFGAANYLVVWDDTRSGSSYDIYGARVTQAGAVLDAGGIPVSQAADNQVAPVAAFDGTDYMVVWQDYRNGSNSDIRAVRMTTSGALGDSIVLSDQSAKRESPALARGPGGSMLATYDGVVPRVGNLNMPANRALGRFITGGSDVGVMTLLAPVGALDSGVSETPACSVFNYGTHSASSYTVRMKIGSFYNQTMTVSGHPVGTSQYVAFPSWTASLIGGPYAVTCSTELAGDANRANDRQAGSVTVQPQGGAPRWSALTPVPLGGKGKSIKDGGALAYGREGDTGYVYAFKGNGRYEFYRYNTASRNWLVRDSIPAMGHSGKKKAVKKGSALAVGTDGKVYGAKGNNTLEFWCYDPVRPDGQHWSQLTDVPPGAKALKEGTGLAAVTVGSTNYIYLLRGSGTTDFYRYNINVPGWETMTSAPTGLSGKTYKNGSSIALDGRDTIWCLKGSYNEFAAYSVAHNTWVTKDNLPLVAPPGTKKTKVKDGSQIASDGSRTIYALKGDNTNEFWTYACNSRTWTVASQMPAMAKKVKGGGALVAAPELSALYAFRGNNTLEFWQYGPLSADGSSLAADGQPKDIESNSSFAIRASLLSVTPNPFTTSVSPSISYSLPFAGNVSLRLYDVSGKLLGTLVKGRYPAGSYSCSLFPAHYSLAGGVYLLKFETEGHNTTEKLVVE
jgi:hypothetical protein